MSFRNETARLRRIVAGVDGGGAKTACIIVDESGRILGHSVTKGSNHQICGISSAMEEVYQSINNAAQSAGLEVGDLSFIYLGLAGADLKEDFEILNGNFERIIHGVPFKIVNDTWIAFSSMTNSTWGATSVCGTGNNLAVKDKEGNIYSVRALKYVLGNYGGGQHLADMAMHYAFRCDESTGSYTKLAETLPACCDCADMNELATKTYKSNYQYHKAYNIPKLVFDLAEEGDKVCLEIIARMGIEIGTMLGGLIAKAGLENENIPVVLSGSQYTKDTKQLMIAPLEEQLRKTVPYAEIKVLGCSPVVGAALSAMKEIGVELEEKEIELIRRDSNERFYFFP